MSIQKRLPFLIAAAFGSAHGFANGNSCSMHDHLCTYHAVGRPITSYKGIDNDETRLVIYGRVLNTPDGKPVDFDNHVMLPTHNTETNESTGSFVVSPTAYGGRNPSEVKVEDWERTSDNPATEGAHIYPSQYQVIFNKNTAKARHSGDFNGGENGNIPNAVGCPGHTGNPKDCEAVIITGNVPSGVYSQKLHMFNHHKQENPEANIRMGAWATGQGVLVVKHHDPNFAMASVSEEQEVHGADVNLVGNKAQSQQVDYHFHNNGFDPHAAGTAAWHYGFTQKTYKNGSYQRYNPQTNTIDTIQNVRHVSGHLTTTVQADGTASTRRHTSERAGQYVAGRKPVVRIAAAGANSASTQVVSQKSDWSFSDIPLVKWGIETVSKGAKWGRDKLYSLQKKAQETQKAMEKVESLKPKLESYMNDSVTQNACIPIDPDLQHLKAQRCVAPLGGGKTAKSDELETLNSWADKKNLNFVHEHIKFVDPTANNYEVGNIGFFGWDGTIQVNNENMGRYDCDARTYDIKDVMRNIGENKDMYIGKYNLATNNCQDFVSDALGDDVTYEGNDNQ